MPSESERHLIQALGTELGPHVTQTGYGDFRGMDGQVRVRVIDHDTLKNKSVPFSLRFSGTIEELQQNAQVHQQYLSI